MVVHPVTLSQPSNTGHRPDVSIHRETGSKGISLDSTPVSLGSRVKCLNSKIGIANDFASLSWTCILFVWLVFVFVKY